MLLLVGVVALLLLAISARGGGHADPAKYARGHTARYWHSSWRGRVAKQRRLESTIRRLHRQELVLRRRARVAEAGSEQVRRLNSDIGYAIDYVFGPAEAPGARTVAHCESTYDDIGLAALNADNGQGYYGIFQLGDPGMWEIHQYAFDRYTTVLDQVLAAYRMWAHRGWGAWQCRPDGGLRW